MNARTFEQSAANAERHLRHAYRYARVNARRQDERVDVERMIRAAVSQQYQCQDENERGN